MLRDRGLLARRCCASLLAANLALGSPAWAKKTPAQLTPTFKDRAAAELGAKQAKEAKPHCAVNFSQILDERRSPELVGVIEKRAVRAPADAQAWMKAVLAGLHVRGVTAKFDPPASAPSLSSAVLRLQTAWIASTPVTYSANVVVKLEAQGVGGGAINQTYRGRVSRTAYWLGGVDTLQSAIDGAFADALDAMAVDLQKVCLG